MARKRQWLRNLWCQCQIHDQWNWHLPVLIYIRLISTVWANPLYMQRLPSLRIVWINDTDVFHQRDACGLFMFNIAPKKVPHNNDSWQHHRAGSEQKLIIAGSSVYVLACMVWLNDNGCIWASFNRSIWMLYDTCMGSAIFFLYRGPMGNQDASFGG